VNKPRILVIGSINMDLTLTTDTFPRQGEAVFGDAYQYHPGGKGANQASAAALLGADVWFAGKIGRDDNGLCLRENLEGFGVHTQGLLEDAHAPTGLATIIVERAGRNRILVFPSANMQLTGADVIPLMKEVRPDAIMLQLEIPDITVVECYAAAQSMKIPVIIDAGPAKPFPIEKLRNPLVFSPNETETEVFCGILPDTDQNTGRAAQSLWEQTGATYVVIKRGEHGAYLYDGKGCSVNFPALPVHAVDSTAAGDAFTAALTVYYLRTQNIAASICYANAAGALSVMKAGAQSSLPTAVAVDQFARANMPVNG